MSEQTSNVVTYRPPCGCILVVGAELDTSEPCPVHINSNADGKAILAAMLCDVLRPGAPYPPELQAALGISQPTSPDTSVEGTDDE